MTGERLRPLTGESTEDWFMQAVERFHCLDEFAQNLLWSCGRDSSRQRKNSVDANNMAGIRRRVLTQE